MAMTTSPAIAARSIVHLAAYLIAPEARGPMNVSSKATTFRGAKQAGSGTLLADAAAV